MPELFLLAYIKYLISMRMHKILKSKRIRFSIKSSCFRYTNKIYLETITSRYIFIYVFLNFIYVF